MSLTIPSTPAGPDGGYHERPSEYSDAIQKALSLFKEQTAAAEGWEDLPEKDDVKLSRKKTSEDPYDIPIVKGVTTVESTTPPHVLATILLPGLRKKWDPRFDEGHAVARYSANSYEFYSVMKSPSYFIWARDIVGVQENIYNDDGNDIVVIQTSVEDEENLPDAGSYQKSRTRATVDVSAWHIKKKGDDVELTYVVKVHLNGSIPTSAVSLIANETPMCCARVRDVHYEVGFHPYDLHSGNSSASDPKTVNVTQTFEDDKGEKKWTGVYKAVGAEQFKVAFDGKRMYASGIDVQVEGEAAGEVETTVDGENNVLVVDVKEGAKGKGFSIIITPQ